MTFDDVAPKPQLRGANRATQIELAIRQKGQLSYLRAPVHTPRAGAFVVNPGNYP